MTDLSDLITIAITTSPTASDPSIDTIRTTIESVLAFDDLSPCRLLVGCDGVRPEQRPMEDAYDEGLLRLSEYLDGLGGDLTALVPLPHWGHQANVARALLEAVSTPLVFMLEGDTPLTPNVAIDWQAAALTIMEGDLHLVRFLHESHVLPEYAHLFIDREPIVSRAGLIHQRTSQWSQRPHIADADWYRDLLATYFAESSRVHVEDTMYGVVSHHMRTYGEHGWDKFRLAIYADPEPTMQRSDHLDGRAGAEKLGQVFAYPGDSWPEGAPAPTLGRVFE